MVHEQKFKDLLSSTCQVSPERIVLDLESEVHYRPGFITHWAVADPGFSPGGGANSQNCYYFSHFCRKLHENERIWTPRGAARPWRPPLGSANAGGNILLQEFVGFHIVKSLMPILALLPISSSF